MTASKQIAGPAGELAAAATTAPNLTPAASKAGQLLSSLRRNHRGGRPKKLKTCVYCGQVFGTSEMRRHKPKCLVRKRPLNEKRPWNF